MSLKPCCPTPYAPSPGKSASSAASWPPPPEPAAASSTWPPSPAASSSTDYTTLPSDPRTSTSSPATDSTAGGQQQSSNANDPNYRRNRSLRVRIADRGTGLVKLETRIPAGFLNGIQALVPQVAGFNLEVRTSRRC